MISFATFAAIILAASFDLFLATTTDLLVPNCFAAALTLLVVFVLVILRS